MNNLSWLLFWADVLPQIANWLCIITGFGFFLLAGVATGSLVQGEETRSHWEYGRDGNEDVLTVKYTDDARAWRKFRFTLWLAPLFFVLWGASFLVPSKDTFYLIAASEAGEQAIQTPEFGKIRKVINQFLDDKIKDDTEEKK